MNEISKLTGLPASTLRFYEKERIIPPIARNSSSKQREYSVEDLDIITTISCLSATGMPLDNMRSYLQNGSRQGSEQAQIELLDQQKISLTQEAQQLQTRRDYINLKIKFWKATQSGDSKLVEEISSQAQEIAEKLRNKE